MRHDNIRNVLNEVVSGEAIASMIVGGRDGPANHKASGRVTVGVTGV